MVVTQASVIGEVAAIGIGENKDEFGDRGSDPQLRPRQAYPMVGFGHKQIYVLSNLR